MLISNPDVFFPAQIRALRYEMQLVRGETWYESLLNDFLVECPLFRKYWQETEGEQRHPIAARPLFPLELTLPEWGDCNSGSRPSRSRRIGASG